MAVQGVLPVQQAIQSQCSTDVIQGKDAVGIPCKREEYFRCGELRVSGCGAVTSTCL